jgi:RNA polymerase sigma-70 factor (ECF subfamily)
MEDDDSSTRLEHRQMMEAAANALGRLDDDDREVVMLSVFEGLSYRDIAVVMDRTLPWVRSRLFRARAGLRRDIQTAVDTPGANSQEGQSQ